MLLNQTPTIYKFVSGEFYVAVDHNNGSSYLYKVKELGGVGLNMFKNYIGVQHFESRIRSVVYIEGHTLVGLDDGRIVKIKRTGGVGKNMFAITQTSNGFKTVSGYNYYIGSHKFKSGIINIAFINSKTLVSFKNKKILKVNGNGGSGYNLFAIIETNQGFTGLVGYNYFIGFQKLTSRVTNITVVSSAARGITFISFRDGRMIKLRGIGSSGENMFAIIKTSYGYKTVQGYNYLVGSNKFKSYITKGLPIGETIFFSLKDGRMMKIKRSGGSGEKMFNIIETSYGFKTFNAIYTSYLLGSYKFPNSSYIIDMDYVGNNLLLCLRNGWVLKIKGVGGTGQNMFNIKKVFGTYQTADPNYTAYLLGSQTLTVENVAHLIYFNGMTFISMENKGQTPGGLTIKIKGTGGTGQNMFAIKMEGNKCYTTLPNYTYWVGCQLYKNL